MNRSDRTGSDSRGRMSLSAGMRYRAFDEDCQAAQEFLTDIEGILMQSPDYLTRSPWMWHPVPETQLLPGDTRADVCVVGAGIAGLSAAYFLAKKGSSVVVIDDGPIGGGMTSRTTAHLSNAIDDRYYELERLHGADKTRLAARSHGAAIDAIEAVCRHEGIECGFTRLDGYLILPKDGDPDEMVEEYRAAMRAEVPGVELRERAPI